MFSLLQLALSFSPHVLTISVFHVLIATSCSVFLSTCPDHLSLPCSHYYILLCLSLHMSWPSQSSMFSLLHLALSFSPHVLTISVFHVLIATSCSVFLSTCPDHLSLPCSHYYILLCLSLHMSWPSQSSMFSLLHLALSFSPHVLTMSVFHVIITTSCSVFLSTCPNHLSLPCSHYYILLCLSLHMS